MTLLRSLRVTHHDIFNRHFTLVLRNEWCQVDVFLISFIKRIKNDVQDDVMRDAI